MSLAKVIKRLCKELRPRVGTFSPRQLQRSLHTGPQGREDAFVFKADEAEKRAEEALTRWREEHPTLQCSSSHGASPPEKPLGVSEKELASVEGARTREEWMLEAPAYLRCLAPKDGPDAKRRQVLEQKRRDDEEAVRVKAVMDEWKKAHKLKSLREMREEGVLTEGEEAYKRWKRNMDAARSVWGKRAAEQVNEQEFKDDAKKGQPWQRFDRDRDLQAVPQVSQAEYQNLLQHTKLGERFKSSWQSSFL